MAFKRSSARVFYYFSRVLFFACWLSVNPSSAVVIPKDCLDMENVAEANINGNVMAKTTRCLTLLFKQNPETTKEFQRFNHTIKTFAEMTGEIDPLKTSVFTAFGSFVSLAAQVIELCNKNSAKVLDNVKDYDQELSLFYFWKFDQVLKNIDDLLVNGQEYRIEKVTNSLLATLREINEKLTDFLWSIKIKKLKVIENQGRALVVNGASAAIAATANFPFWLTLPAVFPLPNAGVVVIAFVSEYASYYRMLHLAEMEKQLEKLQDKMYNYKEKIAIGERKVRNILRESYRIVKHRSNSG